jgi:hypothetical protein
MNDCDIQTHKSVQNDKVQYYSGNLERIWNEAIATYLLVTSQRLLGRDLDK